jgi:hypothetical protein
MILDGPKSMESLIKTCSILDRIREKERKILNCPSADSTPRSTLKFRNSWTHIPEIWLRHAVPGLETMEWSTSFLNGNENTDPTRMEPHIKADVHRSDQK